MNTCDTCKWWGLGPDWYGDDGSADRKLCGSPKITDGEVDDPDIDSASAVDCEDYHAFLKTGAKFGCIHHEQK